MREVDEALSRAYARRGFSGSASSLPPTPHWARRNHDLPANSPHEEACTTDSAAWEDPLPPVRP